MKNFERNEDLELNNKIFFSIDRLVDTHYFGTYGNKDEEIVKAIKDALDKDGVDTSELVIEGTEYEENSPEDEKNTTARTDNGIRVRIKKGDTEIFSHDFVTYEPKS
jgi:hypothetical protein